MHATYLHDNDDGVRLVTLNIEFTQSQFYPGRYFGPPELCYPDDGGEIEITNLSLHAVEYVGDDLETYKTLDTMTDEEKNATRAEYQKMLDTDLTFARTIVEACSKE